ILATLSHQGIDQHIKLAQGRHPLAIAGNRVINTNIEEVFDHACRTANDAIESSAERAKLGRQVDAEEALAHNPQCQLLHSSRQINLVTWMPDLEQFLRVLLHNRGITFDLFSMESRLYGVALL